MTRPRDGSQLQLQGHSSLQPMPPPRFSLENTSSSYLGAGHPDLRPCVDVDATVGLPGDGAAHSVGDAHSQRPAVLTVSQRQERVCSLTCNTGLLSVSMQVLGQLEPSPPLLPASSFTPTLPASKSKA